MIGTVGSDEKAALAKANGCTHTIVYTRENFVERVKQLTGGKGVPVVYDGVGKDTFPASLDCLSAARHVRELRQRVGTGRRRSTSCCWRRRARCTRRGRRWRPTRRSATACSAMADEMFSLVVAGKLANEPRQTYALKDAAQAHRDLESRKTTGATILLP